MAWLTVTEAAVRHKLSRTHIRRLLVERRVKGKKIGSLGTVDERSLTEYLATERTRGRPARNPDKRG